MPHHTLHQQKKYKNYAMLGVLLAVIGLFFGLTIVKITEGNKLRLEAKQESYDQEETKQ